MTGSTGILWCRVSALCFGLFGVNILRVVWRFLLAASALWALGALVAILCRPVGHGRALWQPFAMEAMVYATQTSLYFVAVADRSGRPAPGRGPDWSPWR